MITATEVVTALLTSQASMDAPSLFALTGTVQVVTLCVQIVLSPSHK